jgi:hypothetical protein
MMGPFQAGPNSALDKSNAAHDLDDRFLTGGISVGALAGYIEVA